MTTEELKSLHKLLALKKVMDERLTRLKSEVDKLSKRVERAASIGQIHKLLELKAEKAEQLMQCLCELEAKTAEIYKSLKKKWEKFTPLEALIIQAIYIDGMSWDEFESYVYSTEELMPFRFERSTYMKAHRRALDKLGIPKTGRGGRPRVQKTQGD